MSTDDPLSALHARGRRGLPADPSEDELARHWSLTPADLAEVARCRGDDHRRRFALQLCMLRGAHGRDQSLHKHLQVTEIASLVPWVVS